MAIFFLSLILTTILLSSAYFLRRKPAKTGRLPPGPPGQPFIGSLRGFATSSHPHVYLWELSRRYGPLMRLQLGSRPAIVVSSAELAREVMKTHDVAFSGRPALRGVRKLSYNCTDLAFAPYGEYWRELKRITTIHLFSLKKFSSFQAIREDETDRVVRRVAASAASGRVVNVNELAIAMGSTLICRIAFGRRYDDEGSEMQRFYGLLQDAQISMASLYVSDYVPYLGWVVDLVSGQTSHLDGTFKRLDSFYQELIDDHLDPNRLKKKKEEEEEEDDVLDILIRFKEEKMSSFDLSWDCIKGLLMDIFVAASDTSAAAVVWTMTVLIKTPHILNKVQSEIREAVGEKGRVDETDLNNKLPYFKAVIKESFRLYPPSPLLLPRETTEKCVLQGYEIDPGTLVFINGWAIARDPEYWNNPDEFLPERFLNSSIDVKGQDFGLIPFGSGRRMCPGMVMGLVNVELVLANLLYAFDWELPPGVRVEDIDTNVIIGLTMHKKNALLLVPKPRMN